MSWNRTSLVIILLGLSAFFGAIVINNGFALAIGGGIYIVCMIGSFLVSVNERFDNEASPRADPRQHLMVKTNRKLETSCYICEGRGYNIEHHYKYDAWGMRHGDYDERFRCSACNETGNIEYEDGVR